ncbi:LysR family transcriptional regulator [Hydrogenophaga sp.]|jgi:LysR family nitrogen assimilation transcriptional regulator|uniref:LysR family transcriptional regulator n=1 Tax=Hydrogenophaga sp. TaxID=1904254 RepID=UPI003F6F2852
MATSSPDLDSLRLFIKVAELGNISLAASAVGLSQPSVSRSLRALEECLQAPLFHRTGRGVRLTEVGEQALLRARALVESADQFASDIRDQAQAPSGVVTVALLTAYMRAVGPDLFEEVRRRFPGVVLRLLESFSVQHEDWLGTGRVDIALVTRYRKPSRDGQEVLAVSDLVVVGNPAIGGGGDTIPFRELASVPLVLPAAPNGLRVRVEEVARRLGIRLNVVLEADSVEAQRAIIARDRCYAMWSQHSVRQAGADTLFASRRIVEPRLPRYVVMQTTTHHPLSRASREVARILRRLVLAAHAHTA